MDYAQHISSLVLSIRKKEKLRVRLPLRKIMLPVLDDKFQEDIDQVKDLILSEVNVKGIEYIANTSGIVSKKAKANFKTLGKRLGKNMKAAADLISALTQEEINRFESGGELILMIEGQEFIPVRDDIEIISEDIPGWQVASEDGITVALDITLDDELIAEGTARELVNRIQNLRKSSGLNVTDRINIKVEGLAGIEKAVADFGEYIKSETLADEISVIPTTVVEMKKENNMDGYSLVEWMDGEEIHISIAT
jgi:isoleucyl-tRNA synthetase